MIYQYYLFVNKLSTIIGWEIPQFTFFGRFKMAAENHSLEDSFGGLRLKISAVKRVDNASNLHDACLALGGEKLISLDMEGRQLGRFGQISTVESAVES
jgi:hypothetical protein